MAQTKKAVKQYRYSLYGGVGPNYYFNNLVLAKDKVNELKYSFIGRFMWEPEHLLSLGFETGYYRLYTVNITSPLNAKIKNSAIPIQVVISMKFLKAFYINFSIGRSILLNRVSTSSAGNFNARNISLADLSLTAGYKRKLSDRITLGVETKYYYSSWADDSNLALLFVAGYGFKKGQTSRATK